MKHLLVLCSKKKKFGLTTAIIDIEATNIKTLKNICRGTTSSGGYSELIEIAKEEGIESVASALMTGLPYESLNTFIDTLEFVSTIKNLDAINLYPLMFKPSDAVFHQRRNDPSIFSTPKEKDLMMILAKEILGRAGFSESPSHFYTKKSHIPKQQNSKAQSKTLLGLGPASFGFIDMESRGIQYMNYPDLDRYALSVKSAKTGQWRNSLVDSRSYKVRRFIFLLNSFDSVPNEIVEELKNGKEGKYFSDALSSLINLNLINSNNQGIKLTEKGQLRNSEIIYFLCDREFLSWNFNDSEYELLKKYEFFPSISKDNEVLFDKTLEQQPNLY